MEKRGLSLAEIQEVPKESLMLLVGPPGVGKSTFCQQMVLNGIAAERPIVFVTTEQSPSGLTELLREKGMREPVVLSFVDAFANTVGLATPERPDTIGANCEDLNSISMAINKLQRTIGKKDILLAFDSLTSPYLFNKEEVFRFMKLCLAKFAAEGNSVVALMDEGSGKEEDLVAMMSLCNSVLKLEVKGGNRVLDVVKHPKMEPTSIEVATDKIWKERALDAKIWDYEFVGRAVESMRSGALFGELEQFAVNLFWPNLMRWSGVLWDPKRLPMVTYEVWKESAASMREMIPLLPWRTRLLFRLLIPKDFSKVKDMKKLMRFCSRLFKERSDCIVEYLEDASKTDEHYVRIYESVECWGFEDVGATMASMLPPSIAGACKAFEKEQKDWNAVETKCIGRGDPYCEVKLVPGEIDELEDSLQKDSSVIERIHERLMERLVEFLLYDKPLVVGRTLGVDFLMGENILPMAGGERYRMALRMGGAKAGKEVGERLMDAGLSEDEAVKRVVNFLEHCKIGKITLGDTIRIRQNCESRWTKICTTKWEEPSCFFTTGFLNGVFSAVKNLHIRETKCIAMGDPYCEWEII